MAKKGEKRPWRVQFEWDSGIKGTETFPTADRATTFVDDLRGRAERQGRSIALRTYLNGALVSTLEVAATEGATQ